MCEPEPTSVLRGPLLALGAVAAVSVAVRVADLLGGVLVAAVVVVYALAVAGIVVWVRKYVRPRRREVAKLATSPRAALPAPPRAIGAPVPAVVLGVHDGERLDV